MNGPDDMGFGEERGPNGTTAGTHVPVSSRDFMTEPPRPGGGQDQDRADVTRGVQCGRNRHRCSCTGAKECNPDVRRTCGRVALLVIMDLAVGSSLGLAVGSSLGLARREGSAHRSPLGLGKSAKALSRVRTKKLLVSHTRRRASHERGFPPIAIIEVEAACQLRGHAVPASGRGQRGSHFIPRNPVKLFGDKIQHTSSPATQQSCRV